ncbi:MAG: GHKL domain-containing protein [Ruminococcus sp.]
MPVWIESIIEIANVAVEIFLIFLYLSLLCKRKIEKISLILFYLLSSGILSAVVLLSNSVFLNLITTTALIAIIAFLCFEDTIRNKIFWIAIYLLIISISEPIVIGILCIANIGTPEDFLLSGLGRYLGMIGIDLIYLWLIGLTHRIINKRIRDLPVKYWVLIITIPVISIFLLQTILDSFTINNSINYLSLGISLAGIIFINIVMFNFFESYDDKIKLKYLETLKQQEQENYKLLTLSYKQVREFKHDIENQFSVLNDMLENDDTDAAKGYLVKLSSFVRLANRLCCTGNNAVDSIVNIKGSLAQTYGIEFICKVNIITSIKADELELCRIIGNGLDNAIEGCQRSDVPERHICFSINENQEKLMLIISNTSDEVDPSALISTKKDKGLHGIGISSIRSSVERLNGFMKLEYAEGIFKLCIMVQNDLSSGSICISGQENNI